MPKPASTRYSLPCGGLGWGLRTLFTILWLAAGCDGDGGSSNKGIFSSKNSPARRTMAAHSGQFTKGYQDGLKDAKAAWGDMNNAWPWLWLTEKDYQNGYDRGWKDGRQIARLQSEQATMRSRKDEAHDTPVSPNNN